MVEQGRHGGIQAVRVTQLQGQAFAERAGEDARRIELLQPLEHVQHRRQWTAQALGDLGKRLAEIARLVHQIDQMQADQALGPRQQVQLELLDQVLAQGLRLTEPSREVAPVVGEIEAAAASDRGEAVNPEAAGRIVSLRVAPAVVGRAGRAAGRLAGVHPEAAGELAADVALASGLGLAVRAGFVRRLGPFQERVLLELALDVGGELEVRQLQQLDRLL